MICTALEYPEGPPCLTIHGQQGTASASWRLQGTLRGNLRAVRFSALWGALLPTLEWKYRFTASADVCDQAPYGQGFQDAGPHPHAQGAGEATTCGDPSLQQITS